MRIYLDVCCLNRPFDDQSDDRIKIETEYILLILKKIEKEDYSLVGSDIITYEIEKIQNSDKKEKVLKLTTMFSSNIKFTDEIEKRAIVLENMGFDPLDALHISSAEHGKIDVFLTTDRDVLKTAGKKEKELKVKISNPITWFMDLI